MLSFWNHFWNHVRNTATTNNACWNANPWSVQTAASTAIPILARGLTEVDYEPLSFNVAERSESNFNSILTHLSKSEKRSTNRELTSRKLQYDIERSVTFSNGNVKKRLTRKGFATSHHAEQTSTNNVVSQENQQNHKEKKRERRERTVLSTELLHNSNNAITLFLLLWFNTPAAAPLGTMYNSLIHSNARWESVP